MSVRSRLFAFTLAYAFSQITSAQDGELVLKLERTFKILPPTKDEAAAFIKAQRVEAKKGQQLQADLSLIHI